MVLRDHSSFVKIMEIFVRLNSTQRSSSSSLCVFPSSVVCEIGPAKPVPPSDLPFESPHSGAVEIEVEGGRRGTSQVIFTYRVCRNPSLQYMIFYLFMKIPALFYVVGNQIFCVKVSMLALIGP